MNHSDERISVDALDRYLAGQGTPEEQAQVEAWIAADPRRRVELVEQRPPSPSAYAALQRVLKAPQPASSRTRHAPWHRTISHVAWASAALVAVLAFVFTINHWPHTPSETTATGRVYATSTGQQEIVTLQDGTRITLAPQTTVRLVRFTAHERLVALNGEAAFDVTHAGSEPFVVRTGDVSTRVLGTSFVVRHYASDSHVRVAVTDGKVAVASHTAQRPSVVLPAGYVGDVTDSTASSMRVTDMALYTGWLDGHLAFHEAPTPEVLAALSRWYGYEFRLADSTLASRNLTIVLSTRSLTSAFATLKLVLDVDLAVDGHVVTIVPHRKTSMNPSMKTRNYWNNLTPHDKEVGR